MHVQGSVTHTAAATSFTILHTMTAYTTVTHLHTAAATFTHRSGHHANKIYNYCTHSSM